MNESFSAQPFPRKPLIAVAALVGFSLCAAIVGRLLGLGTPELPSTPPLAIRDVVFQDVPNQPGEVAVYELAHSEPLEILAPGQDNFIRGVLRSFARERKSRHITAEQPFRIAYYADGRLILEDLSTGHFIELQAFGPTNVAAFARFLPSGNPLQ